MAFEGVPPQSGDPTGDTPEPDEPIDDTAEPDDPADDAWEPDDAWETEEPTDEALEPDEPIGESPAPGKPTGATPDAAPHHRLRITLISVLAALLLIGGGLTYVWFDLNRRINQVDIGGLLGANRPSLATPTVVPSVYTPGDPFAGRALNILVLGTDSRDGNNSALAGDDVPGSRSDTTFIAHVSANRTRVDIVSIPRDTWITIPDCVTADGTVIPEAGWTPMGFNAAFAYGAMEGGDLPTGAACSIRAVEEMTNVHIDAYVVVDFTGFVNVVDALGGLDVTLLCPIVSPAAMIDLPAGLNHLDGTTAVGLARARKGAGLGDGSDLQRIRRQHVIFSAMVDKALGLNYVTDLPKLYNMLGAMLGSVTTDLGNLTDIAGFAYSLRNLSTKDMTFVMIPVADAGNGSNVVVLSDQAQPIFDALRYDWPLPVQSDTTPSAGPSDATPTDSPETAAATPSVPTIGIPGAPLVQIPDDCG